MIGVAMMFVFSLVGFAVIGMITVLYAAHSFLTAWTDTLNGVDRIRWPGGDTLIDWIPKLAYLLVVVGFWAFFTIVLWSPLFVVNPLAFAIVAPIFLVLVLPLSLFSTTASGNWVMFLHPGYISYVFRRPFWFLATAFLTILPIALGVLCFLSAYRFGTWMVIIAGTVSAFALLNYARLWGCYFWLVTDGYPDPNSKRKKKKKRKVDAEEVVGAASDSKDRPARSKASDPWAISPDPVPELDVDVDPEWGAVEPDYEPRPEEPEDEWTPNKKPYGVMSEDRAKETWKKPKYGLPGEIDQYDLGDQPEPSAEETSKKNRQQTLATYYDERRRAEKERKLTADHMLMVLGVEGAPPTPTRIISTAGLGFAFYDTSLGVLLALSLAFSFTFFLIFMMIAFFPAGL